MLRKNLENNTLRKIYFNNKPLEEITIFDRIKKSSKNMLIGMFLRTYLFRMENDFLYAAKQSILKIIKTLQFRYHIYKTDPENADNYDISVEPFTPYINRLNRREVTEIASNLFRKKRISEEEYNIFINWYNTPKYASDNITQKISD